MRYFMFALLIVVMPALGSVTSAAEADDGTAGVAESHDAAQTAPLYLLTYDHGGLILWGRDHFVEHLRSAIDWLDRYPSFKIGLDNEAHTYDELARQHPEVLQEIRRYLRSHAGRFGIGTCTYGQPLSVFIDGESNIRQIGYALEADRRHFGCRPDVYLMSEHAMHSQMPQILNGFGFNGAIMRTHYMMYGYNPTFDAAIGWWVGLDGSRIATVPTYEGQGAQFGRTTVDNWILTRYPGDNAPKSPADFRKEFARIRPLLATRADDAGLRKEALVREYEGKPGYQWILLDEVLSLLPDPVRELPTAPNDFVVRMPWGYCGNEIWNTSRRAEIAVQTAERLAAIERLRGGPDRHPELKEAWKNLLVAQHHDIQICGLLSDARRFLSTSIGISESVMKTALQSLASQMSGDRPQVVVFNPLSWRRAEWIEVPVSLPRGYATNLEVRHGQRVVPSALLSADLFSDGSLRDIRLAVGADVEGLSVASLELIPVEPASRRQSEGLEVDARNLTVTSPYLEIHLHPQGGISSIKDRRTGRELLGAGERNAFFAGKIEGRDVESRGTWVVRRGQGGAPWVAACENGFIADIPYTLQMKVHRDTPRIDCAVRFHFDGQRIGRLSTNLRDPSSGFIHEDKLRFKLLPAARAKAVGVRDLPFAVSETPDRYVNGLYWTALSDGETGVAFFNRGAMGAVREEDGGFSIPLAYAMYYVWGTRMLSGDFEYEFAIFPFAGPWRRADLHRRALEYNYQPVGLAAVGEAGKGGSTIGSFTVEPAETVVSAFYNIGDDFFVRLCDHEGRRREVSLSCSVGETRAAEVDLAGRELGPAAGSLTVEPWQIRTIRFRPAR